MIAKARVWAIEVLPRGTKRSWCSSERSGRRDMAEKGKRIRSRKYLGPICEREINVRTLSWIRGMSGSQWKWSNKKAGMWDARGSREISLAAAFRTDWRGERRTNQERIAIIYSRADKGMDNRGRDIRGDEGSDCSKPPHVEIGRASEISNMFWEGCCRGLYIYAKISNTRMKDKREISLWKGGSQASKVVGECWTR